MLSIESRLLRRMSNLMRKNKAFIAALFLLLLPFLLSSKNNEREYCLDFKKFPHGLGYILPKTINGKIKSLKVLSMDYSDIDNSKLEYEDGYPISWQYEFHDDKVIISVFDYNNDSAKGEYKEEIRSRFICAKNESIDERIRDGSVKSTSKFLLVSDKDDKQIFYKKIDGRKTISIYKYEDNSVYIWDSYKRYQDNKKYSALLNIEGNKLEYTTFNARSGNISSKKVYIDGILMEEMDGSNRFIYSIDEGIGVIKVYDHDENFIRESYLERKLDEHRNIVYEKVVRPDGAGRVYTAEIEYY